MIILDNIGMTSYQLLNLSILLTCKKQTGNLSLQKKQKVLLTKLNKSLVVTNGLPMVISPAKCSRWISKKI